MGDVDGGDPETFVQPRQLGAHRAAQLRIEVGERLVHEEEDRLSHDRSAHRHALALAARERRGLASEQRVEAQRLRGLLDTGSDLVLRHAPHLQAEAEVLAHGHMRVEGVGLEDHGDIAVLGCDAGDVAIADPDAPARERLEARDHAQQRGLAAAGGPDEDQALAIRHVDLDPGDGIDAVGVALRDVLETQWCHLRSGRGRVGEQTHQHYDEADHDS